MPVGKGIGDADRDSNDWNLQIVASQGAIAVWKVEEPHAKKAPDGSEAFHKLSILGEWRGRRDLNSRPPE